MYPQLSSRTGASYPITGLASSISPSYTTATSGMVSKPYTTSYAGSGLATYGASYATPATYSTGASTLLSSPMTTSAAYSSPYSYSTATTATPIAATVASPTLTTMPTPLSTYGTTSFSTTKAAKVISGSTIPAVSTVPITNYGNYATVTKAAPLSNYSYTTPTVMGMGMSSANLLAMGNVISERIISAEECLALGVLRREEAGLAPAAVPMVQTMPVAGELQVDETAPPQEVPPAERPPRVIIICTSADRLEDGHPTGAWSEEITGPYYQFADAGCEVFIVSVSGGKITIDEASLGENFITENDKRFAQENGLALLENAASIGDFDLNDVDCIFLAGGHGTCVDFPNGLAQLVSDAAAMGKIVGAVCHGPLGLLGAITPEGQPLIEGKQVCGFSNEEEVAVGLAERVPFLLQNQMQELGAQYVCGEPWSEFAVRDGTLVTGQNPQSSVMAARLCLEGLGFTFGDPQ